MNIAERRRNGHWMVTEMCLPFSRMNVDWKLTEWRLQFSRNGCVSSCDTHCLTTEQHHCIGLDAISAIFQPHNDGTPLKGINLWPSQVLKTKNLETQCQPSKKYWKSTSCQGNAIRFRYRDSTQRCLNPQNPLIVPGWRLTIEKDSQNLEPL